jgi:hypothetical protein
MTNRSVAPVKRSGVSALRRALSVSLALGVLALGASASAGGGGAITNFDAPGAGTGANQGTFAVDINFGGSVIGYTIDDNTVFHGFLRECGGKTTILNAPGAGSVSGSEQGTVAYSINAEGTIAGLYQDVNFLNHGFIRSPEGHYTTFDVPGAGTGAGQGTFAVDINGLGVVAGYFADASSQFHGFTRSPSGTFTKFEAPGSGTGADVGTVASLENGLNDFGSVTGWYFDSSGTPHGYVRDASGSFSEFDVAKDEATYVGAISDLGVVVGGDLDQNSVFHGYVRSASGSITTFEAPGAGKAAGSYNGTFAVGVTEIGTITGYVADANTIYHGFVRAPDGSITDFDAPGAGTAAPEGTVPQAINWAGEIVGYVEDANSVNHGFVRTP